MSRGPPLASGRDVASRPAGRTTANNLRLEKLINRMSNLSKYYFQGIPAAVMDEIIAGVLDGKPEPTLEEMEEWLTAEREREAERLLAQYC